ncbi:hypothetical protein EDB89DRAFT_1909077 [Lactarius sanguifluus]|nr:hypothetical protein EDB89DRAFT_1909077 [Lactarius sanguifluus]
MSCVVPSLRGFRATALGTVCALFVGGQSLGFPPLLFYTSLGYMRGREKCARERRTARDRGGAGRNPGTGELRANRSRKMGAPKLGSPAPVMVRPACVRGLRMNGRRLRPFPHPDT